MFCFKYQGCHQTAVKAIPHCGMVWLSFIQMHHVSRYHPSEISRAVKKCPPKIKLVEGWGLLGSQVTGLSGEKAGKNSRQEPGGGSEAAWRSMACWLASLDCSAAFFILQGSTHGGLHTQWAITETLPQTLHRAIWWSSSRVEVSFSQVCQASNWS